MENENRNLLLILTQRVKNAKMAIKSESNDVLIKQPRREYETYTYNKKYISDAEFGQIVALFNTIKDYPDVPDEEFVKLINKKPILFRFLRKLNKRVEDFIGELREHGIYYVVIRYSKQLKNKEELRSLHTPLL